MSTYTCPKGHSSAEPDYCDTCGAAIAGAPTSGEVSPPTVTIPAVTPTVPSADSCPVCATPRSGDDRFCENDGYDFTTGRRPDALTAAPPTPTTAAAGSVGLWTATAEADRGYYDRTEVDGVDFPAVCPPRTFTLSGTMVRIGRRSHSKGIDPEMDLSGPPLDPGISHLHAVLTAVGDGWSLTDPGSTNGTTLNGSREPLTPAVSVDIADGDQIHLGAWTTITLRAPA